MTFDSPSSLFWLALAVPIELPDPGLCDMEIEMATAPEPFFSAGMHVLYWTFLKARVWGWSGDVNPAMLADLMDAVHNVPHMIGNWTEETDARLRRELSSFDERWPDSAFLVKYFEAALTGEHTFHATEEQR